MIFSVHTPTCSIHFEEDESAICGTRWKHRIVRDPNHHRPLWSNEREPLIVMKDNECIVRTDWAALLKTATEDELRGRK